MGSGGATAGASPGGGLVLLTTSDLLAASGAMALGLTDFILNTEQAERFGDAYMRQVLEYEALIRAAIPHAPPDLAAEGRALLQGRPETGTRKDALRDLAYRMGQVVPAAVVVPPLPY